MSTGHTEFLGPKVYLSRKLRADHRLKGHYDRDGGWNFEELVNIYSVETDVIEEIRESNKKSILRQRISSTCLEVRNQIENGLRCEKAIYRRGNSNNEVCEWIFKFINNQINRC